MHSFSLSDMVREFHDGPNSFQFFPDTSKLKYDHTPMCADFTENGQEVEESKMVLMALKWSQQEAARYGRRRKRVCVST